MRKLISLLASAALGAGLLTAPAFAQDKGTVGIAMPTKSSARWISDGNSMVEQFTKAGYETDLQKASDIEIRAKQILRLRETLVKIMSKTTGQSVAQVQKDIDRDFFMNAEEAKKYGVIDKIL